MVNPAKFPGKKNRVGGESERVCSLFKEDAGLQGDFLVSSEDMMRRRPVLLPPPAANQHPQLVVPAALATSGYCFHHCRAKKGSGEGWEHYRIICCRSSDMK